MFQAIRNTFVASVCFSGLAYASQTAASTAQKEGQQAQAIQSLEPLLELVLREHQLPALGGAIVKGAELVAVGAVGVRARGKDELVTARDLWHLGSCTKAMTATLAGKLVEQGKLEWSTTVGEVFVEWKDSLHADWRDVPIEWLLQNRGGVSSEPPPKLWSELYRREDSAHDERQWFVEQLLREAPSAKPGTQFVYSNQGFTIAGAMLEELTGKTWEELLQRELFEPLGMSSAGFGAPGSAASLDQPRGHSLLGAVPPGPRADNPAAIGPAGTVHASLSDWAKFVGLHLAGERGIDGLLKAETLRKLHESPAENSNYAMGWVRDTRAWAGGDVLWHNGSNTMWYCVTWLAPEKDYAFLATTNSGGDKASKACDAAIGALIKHAGLGQ